MKKITQLALAGLVGITLAISGCSKDVSREGTEAMEISGVKVDLPKMEQAFATASDEMKAAASDVTSAVRYGQHTKAMMVLENLSADTTLTPEQKQIVTTVFEQVKQLAAAQPPADAPPADAQ